MTKKAFDKIAEGLTEALAVARGDASPARLFIPAEIDIRAIRQRLGMSQDAFASAFGFSLTQIRDWEQGRSRPLAAYRAYLLLIERDPAGVLSALREVSEPRKRIKTTKAA
jgi:putative transcriptional regulator